MRNYSHFFLVLLITLTGSVELYSQCDPGTPTFNVDLSTDPNSSYTSPSVARVDYCCTASGTDKCIEFVVTTHADATTLRLDITAGAIPPGAVFYELNCGTLVALGDGVCVSPGVTTITFCKPGSNNNEYTIWSSAAIPNEVVTDVSCSGGSDGSIDLTTTGNESPYSFLWSTGASSEDVSNLTAGNPGVTIVDTWGCTNEHTFPINQPSALSSIIVCNETSAGGASDGSASVTVTGGTTPFNYSWDSGSTNSTSTGLAAGLAQVTITDFNSCSTVTSCSVSDPVTDYTIDMGGTINTCSGSFYDSGGSAGSYGNNEFYTMTFCSPSACDEIAMTFNSFSTEAGFDNLTIYDGSSTAMGTPVIGSYDGTSSPGTVTSSAGCLTFRFISDASTFNPGWDATINCVPSSPMSVSSSSLNTSCVGGTDGIAYVYPTGGFSPYSYFWNVGQTNASTTGLTAGSYSYTVTDVAGCNTVTSSVVVSDPAPLSTTITSADPLCNGGSDGSITVSVPGQLTSYSFQWNTGPPQFSNIATAITAGSYQVSITEYSPAGVFWTEDFESSICNSGCLATAYSWNINSSVGTNGATPNDWFVSCAEDGQPAGNCGSSCSIQDNSLHIANTSLTSGAGFGCPPGDCGALYDDSSPTEITFKRVESPTIDCSGRFNIDLNFVYIENGEGTDDDASLWYFDGGTWFKIDDLAKTPVGGCGAQGQWTAFNITLPASANNNPNVQLGFLWKNDGDGSANDPSFAVDDLSLTSSSIQVCQTVESVTVSEPTLVNFGPYFINNVSCNGGSDGAMSPVASGGTSPHTYQWYYDIGLSAPIGGETSSSISGLTAGDYYVEATDANGCIATTGTTITEPSPLIAAAGFDASFCESDGATPVDGSPTATGGTTPYTYSWSGAGLTNTTSATATFDPAIAGVGNHNLDITVTDTEGCVDIDQATYTVNPNPTISTTLTDPLCNGGCDGVVSASSSSGTGPFNFSWDGGLGSGSTINSVCAGTYSVTATDANACVATSSGHTVNEPSLLQANLAIDNNETCAGDCDGQATSFSAGGTGAHYYTWGTGGSSATEGGLCPGFIGVSVTDDNGCVSYESNTIGGGVTVTASFTNDGPQCYTGNNISFDASASSTSGAGPLTYNWDYNDGNFDIGINPSHSYSATGAYNVFVTVTDGACYAIYSEIADVLSEPVVSNSTEVDPACIGSVDGYINTTITGGVPAYSFIWSNGATTQNISGLDGGGFDLTITDGNTCQGSQSFSLTAPATGTVTGVTISDVSCFGGSDGAALVEVSGPGAPFQYEWFDDPGRTNSLGPPSGVGVITGITTGVYYLEALDGGACATHAEVTITEPPALSLSTSSTSVTCSGGVNGVASAIVSGGTTAYSYQWYSDAGYSAPIGGATSSSYMAGAGTYYLEVVDNNSCIIQGAEIIIEPTPLTFSTTSIDASCNGDCDGQINVTANNATPPYTYSSDNGIIFQASSTLTGLCAGNISVVVQDANGCLANALIPVNEPAALVASITATNPSCAGGVDGYANASAIGGTTSYNYLWSNSSPTTGISGLSAGTYTVTVTDFNGCESSTSIVLSDPAGITVDAGLGQSVCANNATLALSGSSNSGAIVWSTSGTGTFSSTTSLATVYLPSNADTTAGGLNITLTTAGNSPCTEVSDVISITITDAPSIDAGSNQTICSTSSASLAATDNGVATAWSWSTSGDGTFSSPTTLSGSYLPGSSDIAGGTITLTVATTAQGSCNSVNDNLILTINPDVVISTTVTNISCNGNNDGSISASASGGSGPYNYLWSNSSTTTGISGLSSGLYGVTASDFLGCQSSISSSVSEPPVSTTITVSTITAPLCFGSSDGFADVDATGSAPPFTYEWFSDSGLTSSIVLNATGNLTNVAAGIYYVEVLDNGACATVSSITISEPPVLSLSQNCNNTSAPGASDGSSTSSVFGGMTSYNYTWSNGATTQNITGLPAGSYGLTVTDSNGCYDSSACVVSFPLTLTGDSCSDPIFLCDTSSFTQATAGYSISGVTQGCMAASGPDVWYKFVVNTSGTIEWTATPAGSGDFDFSLFDVTLGGCPGTQLACDFSAGAIPTGMGGTNPQPLYNATAGQVLSIQISEFSNIGDAFVFTWQGTAGIGPLSTSPVTSDVSCFGGSNGLADITLSGALTPVTYSWSNGATTEDLNNVIAGAYNLTATELGGCTITESISISEPSAISVTMVCNDPSSTGGSDGTSSVAGSGGTGGYTFLWSNGSTGLLITGLSAGTFSVTTTDGNGCFSIDSCAVVDPGGCALTITDNVLANDSCGAGYGSASVSSSGGTSPYTFLWSNGSTSNLANGLAGGTNFVTITDAASCSAIQTVTVPGVSMDSVYVTTNPAACGASDGSATVNIVGGTSPFLYIWFNAALDSIGTGSSLSNIPAGTYIAAVGDGYGCEGANGNFVYNVGGPLPAGISTTDATCMTPANGEIQAAAINGTPPYSFDWQVLNTTLTYSGPSLTGVPKGVYILTITDSQIPACKTFNTAAIGGPEPIDIQYTVNPESCFGNSDANVFTSVTGGVSPYSYSWNNGTSGNNLTNVSSGNYSLTISDAFGCELIDFGSISLTSNMTITVTSTAAGCSSGGGAVSASASGGVTSYTYVWGGLGTGATQTGVATGTYIVTIVDGIGCSDTASVFVPGGTPISFLANTYSDTCSAGIGMIKIDSVSGGSGNYEFSLDNISYQLNNLFSDLDSGSYNVFVSDPTGCISSTITSITDTIVDLSKYIKITNDTICANEEATVSVSGGVQTNWITEGSNSSSITISVDSTAYFPVEITKGTCLYLDSALVLVESGIDCWDENIETPNAFSPDGDGVNDYWAIPGIEFTENKVTIFNRWGDYIAEIENYDNQTKAWFGKSSSGAEMPSGTYFYVIEIDGEIYEKDWIQIVR